VIKKGLESKAGATGRDTKWCTKWLVLSLTQNTH